MGHQAKHQNYTLNKIRALVAEPKTDLRKDIIRSLREFGLTDIESTGNLNEVNKGLAEGDLDLLICDTVLPEGDLRDILKGVRFGKTASNPFIVILTLVSNPTADLLNGMMECGPDAILVKPFTPEQLIERIQSLTLNRKKFVVTSSYVGPERRKGNREDKAGIDTIRVPNPLYNKSHGIENLGVSKRATATAVSQVNNQIVESHSKKTTELIAKLFPPRSKINWTEHHLDTLKELQIVAFEMNRRISVTDYKSLGGLTMTLNRMLKDVHKWTDTRNNGDLNLLRILVDVLQQGFEKSDMSLADS